MAALIGIVVALSVVGIVVIAALPLSIWGLVRLYRRSREKKVEMRIAEAKRKRLPWNSDEREAADIAVGAIEDELDSMESWKLGLWLACAFLVCANAMSFFIALAVANQLTEAALGLS